METESHLQVLSYLSRGAETSQRKIAAGTGLSLAMVNVLLKKMVKKGLVKLERVNGKTLRYIITPQGMAEKTKLTYSYLKNSYRQVIKLHRALQEVIENHRGQGESGKVIFYGPRDEVLEILRVAAKDLGMTYLGAQTPEELAEAELTESIVITWHDMQDIPAGITAVNILEKI